jgi:hypothetical protein
VVDSEDEMEDGVLEDDASFKICQSGNQN